MTAETHVPIPQTGAEPRRRWPFWRAVLVTVAIAASLVDGCPVPRASPAVLAQPQNQVELERWAETLTGLGVETTKDELARSVTATAERLASVHGVMSAPVRPVFDVLRLSQRWSLFPIAETEARRMEVAVACPSSPGRPASEVLYRPLDPEADFLGPELEYRRVRATWNPGSGGPRPAYRSFVTWLARRVARARPDCTELRVRFEVVSLPPPGETESRVTDHAFEERRSLDALRSGSVL